MATVIGVIVGMLIGGLLLGSGGGALVGALVGAFVGFIIRSRKERDSNMRPEAARPTASFPVVAEPVPPLADRVSMLERRVAELERALPMGARAIDAHPAVVTAPAAPSPETVVPSVIADRDLPPPAPQPAPPSAADRFSQCRRHDEPRARFICRAIGCAARAAFRAGARGAAESGLGMDRRRQHAGTPRCRAPVHRRRLPAEVRGRARAGADLASPRRHRAGRRRAARDRLAAAREPARLRDGAAGWRRRRPLHDRVRRAASLRARLARRGLRAARGDLRVVLLPRGTPGCDFTGGARRRRRLPRADPHVEQHRQPRDAVQLLRVAQRGHSRHRVVQGVARVEPAGIRVHLPRRDVLGGDAIPARGFCDDGTVPDPVLPVLRRDRGAVCAAPVGRSTRLRRCRPRLRNAARRCRPPERARARHRIRDGIQRAGDVRGLPDPGPLPLFAPPRRHPPAGGEFPGARHRIRDAGRSTRARRALDLGDLGDRGRGDRVGGHAAFARRRARIWLAAAGRRRHRVPARAVAVGARRSGVVDPARQQRLRRRVARLRCRFLHVVDSAAASGPRPGGRACRGAVRVRLGNGVVAAGGMARNRPLRPVRHARSGARRVPRRDGRAVRRAGSETALADRPRPGVAVAAGPARHRLRGPRPRLHDGRSSLCAWWLPRVDIRGRRGGGTVALVRSATRRRRARYNDLRAPARGTLLARAAADRG